ncbi:hypothetical protein HFO32_34875 [Rhizobium leguminosarum]|uniref:hypothetical protein n=1 Tax=Rhizobium TaxID=379 RepID=UPI001C919F7F|nr:MULTISPECIES: hypothetical protein [Rhizobium]MBY3052515.1 hypothetical protein [Rhizobium laguerreae]MBY5673593.1 hypothetical protein [Rhizobium leguminosarum]MBY5687243.1 hypothetical protein [Rhizobium leguminosarum]
MSGQLIRIWPETWSEIWTKLQRASFAPDDLYIELLRQVIPAPLAPTPPAIPPAEAFNEAGELIDLEALQARDVFELARKKFDEIRQARENAISGQDTRDYFREALALIATESEAVRCIERAYDALGTFDEEAKLKEKYRELVVEFLERYNLRYQVRGGCTLHPTVSGLFATMLLEVRRVSDGDDHITELLTEFEDAFADLKIDRTATRLKTCLQKQYNLLEALGAACPGVDADTLGAMCDQIDWPHATIKEVGKKLYGFGSNYPGLRHAGKKKSQLRTLTMRDFVSISLMLAAFTPYVASELEADRCYTC